MSLSIQHLSHLPLWKLEQLHETQVQRTERAEVAFGNARIQLELLERHISVRRGERRGKADVNKEQRYG